MQRNISILLLSVAITAFCSCKSLSKQKEFINPIAHVEKISFSPGLTDSLILVINLSNYRPAVIIYKNNNWLSFLNKSRKSLILLNLLYPGKTDSLLFTTKNSGSYFLEIIGNTFYFYFPGKSILEIQTWSNNRPEFSKELALPMIPEKYVFDQVNWFQILDTANPKVLISYGAHNSWKYNYRDPEGEFIILDPQVKTLKKIGYYPRDFFSSQKYYTGTLFATGAAGDIFYTHELHDSVYKIKVGNNDLNSSVLENNTAFDKFDWKKETDLAYVRKYTALTEENEAIRFLKSDNIIIIKRLRKQSVSEQTRYKYFVLDTGLNLLYSDTIRHRCYPKLISSYRKGFLLSDDSLKNGYYYEIK